MSKPTISITIPDSDKSFNFEEKIKCKIHISVTKETKCQVVTL